MSCHTLIHGGFGHRPLLSEELVLIGFYFNYLVLMGNSLKFGQIYFLKAFASLSENYHHQFEFLNLSLLI